MAGRWPDTHAATVAAELRGWTPAPGRSHLSLHIENIAVMIHLMRGAGEPGMCPSSCSCPGLGQTLRPDFGGGRMPFEAILQLVAVRARPLAVPCRKPRLGDERNHKIHPPCRSAQRAVDCASFTLKAVASRQAGPLVLACGPGGELTAPGPFARLGERRRKTDTAVSDLNLLGLHPLCGKKVLPERRRRRHRARALDLSIDSANNRLSSPKKMHAAG